ncbi:type II toxin-antitoxin system RelE/ParE family toxin [Allopusillimonas ginsengisoli]|uniref:type II toxin-antitoxin system RelE/ParE family toxin n=1 Tax=Allopusillimonas ginsengisoli TaxID=453575 RepID=UPI00101F163B|nr:type II toxin-antitoxin system RelE/ParE family toxin [Allopusillimonas ginsengisoli]TEA78222.1 Killer protein [Allopusillimonas ginsengisoli]
MIKRFRHKGLERFFRTSSVQGIQPNHAKKLGQILRALDVASEPGELNLPGFGLHPLHGNLRGYWSIVVNGNWRVTFVFDGNDVDIVDYQDYH